MKNIPRFVVVGHPNKGKSSIVSALAQDDSVKISDTPGTTQKRRVYPLRVDGVDIYELIDTPGFQRARRVLAYINQNTAEAHKRRERILEFIKKYKDEPLFHDEVELLEPIMKGSGIIYVVDGSKPYGTQYEAEMEILRFTAMPSMALINMIGQEDYSKEWKTVLNQYFKIVKTYNPVKAKFQDNIDLLEAVSYLEEEWTQRIKSSIQILLKNRKEKMKHTASLIAKNVIKSIMHTEVSSLRDNDVLEQKKEFLRKKYKENIADFEVDTQKELKLLWNHGRLETEQNSLDLTDINLFSTQSQSIFGLSKQSAILAAMASGGAGGATFDMLVGGSSLMLGSVIGATIGAASAYFGYEELADIKILGQKLSRNELKIGPVKNINFPYILLSRFIIYSKTLISRSHALRDKEDLRGSNALCEQLIDSDIRKELEKFHANFRKADEISKEEIEGYSKLILKILEKNL